jgi:hypothetical protein
MFARISTVFDCKPEQLWEEISRPSSLKFVSAPLLHFESLVEGELDNEWAAGKTYTLRLYLFGFLPAGRHNITIASIDRNANIIESKERGTLSPVWNHTIRFHPLEGGKLHYTDEIEIRAGLLTVIIWAFAHLFYRHRQRRWKKLLQSLT